MARVRYVVITKADEYNEANLCDEVLRMSGGTGYVVVKAPVFQLGEILVVDENGREIGGHQRMPDKWIDGESVDAEVFVSVQNVVKRAREVMSLVRKGL